MYVIRVGCFPETASLDSPWTLQASISRFFATALHGSTHLMSRNVMSPTVARRLGACAHNITKSRHHAHISTTSFRSQESPSDRQQDHLDRVAWMQADDMRRLVPLKAKIKEYQAECDKAHEFLASLPAALEPLESLSPARPLKEHRAVINVAMESLNRLKNKKLPNLLANVEDLETEAFPEPGSQESELAFMQRIGGMTAGEKQDQLRSLTMAIQSVVKEATDRMPQETDGSRSPNPFAAVQLNPLDIVNKKKSEVGEDIRAGDKLKFGLSTEEQFASVVAGATKAEDAIDKKIKKKVKTTTAGFGLGQDTEDATASEASASDSKKDKKEKKEKEKKKAKKEDAPMVELADASKEAKEATTSDGAEPTKPVIRKTLARMVREIKQTVASDAVEPAKGPAYFRLALEHKEATTGDAVESTKPVADTTFSRLAQEKKESIASDAATTTKSVAGTTLSRLARDLEGTSTSDSAEPAKPAAGTTVSRLAQEAEDTVTEKPAASEAESSTLR